MVAAAARSPRAAEPISAEVLARLGRPLPAPIRTAVARSDFGMVASGSPEATDAGDLVAALGAPSSNRIPSIITNVISNLVDRRMGLAEAVETPRVLAAGPAKSTAAIEVSGAITAAQVDLLEAMGCDGIDRMDYPPTSRKIVVFGGINAVGWDAGAMTFVGVGDGRRWGSAQGPATVSVGAPGR